MDDPFRVLSSAQYYPGYRKRRVVGKSSSGCVTCKLKKVKCDEAAPTCSRCRRNGWSCAYSINSNSAARPKALAQPPSSKHIEAPAVPFSVLSPVTPLPFHSANAHAGTPCLQLLTHCEAHWADIFPGIRRDDYLGAFRSTPLIQSITLSMVACHLRHLEPQHKPHRVAEHFQQSIAMQEYRNALSAPIHELGQLRANYLMLGAVMLSLLVFPLAANTSSSSSSSEESPLVASPPPWVRGEFQGDMGWLIFQAGLGPLLKSMSRYMTEALRFLGPVFSQPTTPDRAWYHIARKRPPVPKNWVDFFGLESRPPSEKEAAVVAPYDEMVETGGGTSFPKEESLAEDLTELVHMTVLLRGLEPSLANAVVYRSFTTKAQHGYRKLLRRGEERAWWLYGYWFGLLCRFGDLWWYKDRARTQHRAILTWLRSIEPHKRPGRSGVLWGQMMAELEHAPYIC